MQTAWHTRDQSQVLTRRSLADMRAPSALYRRPSIADFTSSRTTTFCNRQDNVPPCEHPSNQQLAEEIKLLRVAVEATLKQNEITNRQMDALSVMTVANAQHVAELSERIMHLIAQAAADMAANNNNNEELKHVINILKNDTAAVQAHATKRDDDDESNTERKAIQLQLAQAVAEYLDDGQVLATGYKYKETMRSLPNDLDGLVIGNLPGTKVPVLVLCETKWSWDAKWDTAACVMYGNKVRIYDLQDADPDDPDAVADAQFLQAEKLKDRKLMVAFGSSDFTDDVRNFVQSELNDYRLTNGWFEIQLGEAVVVKPHIP